MSPTIFSFSVGVLLDIENYIPFVLAPILYWGVRRYLISKDQFISIKKKTLIIGIVSFFITELGRSFYRPYIYKNQIEDFFIADTIGNSFGTLTAVFMIITLAGSGTRKDWNLIFIVITGLLGYEFINLPANYAFDIHDIYATLIFGLISIIIYHYLLKRYSSTPENV